MANNQVETDFSIRFIGISEGAVSKLKQLFKEEHLNIRKYYKDKRFYVAVYDLNENCDAQKINSALVEIEEGEKDIFVSIVSSCDSDIIDIPDFVKQYLLVPGVGMKISFTII